jgi:hypothetical protein
LGELTGPGRPWHCSRAMTDRVGCSLWRQEHGYGRALTEGPIGPTARNRIPDSSPPQGTGCYNGHRPTGGRRVKLQQVNVHYRTNRRVGGRFVMTLTIPWPAKGEVCKP